MPRGGVGTLQWGMVKRQESGGTQKKPESFEAAMEELEQIVAAMEAGQTPLDESLRLYERGTFLVKHCQQRLDAAESQIRKLSRAEDGSLEAQPMNEE